MVPPKLKDLAYETPSPRPRPAWVQLPLDGRRVAAYLPNRCCQCLAAGDTRIYEPFSVSVSVSVFLCPTCRAAWRRRTRQVVIVCASAMALTVVAAVGLIALRARPHLSPGQLVAATSSLVRAASFLSLPITHFLATPLLIGWAGMRDKAVWIRFPNAAYVALIGKE